VSPRPSLFLVGHSKSGTTALADFLGQHPDVHMARVKEPNHFCPDFCRADPARHPESAFRPQTDAAYAALFDGAAPGQRLGEASAAYLYSAEAAARIAAAAPDARIVMVFREPASFVRSYHLQLLKNPVCEGETVGDLAQAIALEPERRAGRAIPEGCLLPEFLHYTTDRLAYDAHYDRFAAAFPPEQILALTYEQFRADNAGTMRRVFAHVGVDPSFAPDFGEHNRGGQRVKSKGRQGLLRRISHGEGVFATVKPLVKAVVPQRLRRTALRGAYRTLVFEPAPPMPAALRDEIRARARPHVAALGERMGRDLLVEWGYDGAGG